MLFLLLSLIVFLGLASLALNLTWLTCHQVRLRKACEAAALAGAVELLDPAGPTGIQVGASATSDPATVSRVTAARQQAMEFAARNGVILRTTSGVAPPAGPDDDVVAGWVNDPSSPADVFEPWSGAGPVNSLFVRAIRRRSIGDAVTLWLGRAFGVPDAEPAAAATASIDQRVYGFRPAGHVPVPLVPLMVFSTLRWPSSAAGAELGLGDGYVVDSRTRDVRSGADGIAEITLHVRCSVGAPGAGQDAVQQNACWLSLSGQGTGDALLTQQVVQGLAPNDLAALGGSFALGSDGGLLLPVALPAGAEQLASVQQAFLAVRGQRRIWPLGSLAVPADQNLYLVQGFAAGCVVACQAESESSLAIVVQPCSLETCTALVRSGTMRNPWIGKLIVHD